MGKVTIRRATPADALEAAAMFSAVMKRRAFAPKLHSDEEDKAFVANFIASSETWLATKDRQIVGLACIDGDRLAHLYVHPKHHNQRIGSALLKRVKDQRQDGFDLWTFQANTGARRFYERHGCEPVEFTDGSRNEEKLPDVRYAWPGERT